MGTPGGGVESQARHAVGSCLVSGNPIGDPSVVSLTGCISALRQEWAEVARRVVCLGKLQLSHALNLSGAPGALQKCFTGPRHPIIVETSGMDRKIGLMPFEVCRSSIDGMHDRLLPLSPTPLRAWSKAGVWGLAGPSDCVKNTCEAGPPT